MHGGSHVEGLIVVVRAIDGNEAGGQVSANHIEEVREAHSAEAANYVPSFDANMPGILREFGQILNLRESVISRLLYRTCDFESPCVEINSGVINVIVVDRELIERRDVGVSECGRQMSAAEELCRSPIAESEAAFEQRLLQSGNGKSSQRQHRCEFQQLPPGYAFELAVVDSRGHNQSVTRDGDYMRFADPQEVTTNLLAETATSRS